MKKTLIISAISLTIFCLNFSASAAEIMPWKIIPAQSKLEFKAIQDGAAVNGSFKKFGGKINFDKNQLAKSEVVIEVDTSSIAVSLNEALGTLQTVEWLSIKAFPQATFAAKKFSVASGKDAFRADGTLTIKGKAIPTTLEFALEEYSATKARAVGKVKIKRSAFGVGNADEKKANGVKDDVEISFVVNAEK